MKSIMKKITALGMVFVMLLAAACGSTTDDSTKATESNSAGETAEQDQSESETTGTDESETGEEEATTYDYGGVTVKAFGDVWGKLNSDEQIYTDAQKFVEEKYNIKLETATIEGSDGTNEDELLIASVQAGAPATDIMNVNPETMLALMQNDILYDITDYYESMEIGSIYTDVATYQGKVYGVSYDNLGDAWCLVYDRDYLEEIGMEKTPTEMFMDGNWDYDSFTEYLREMKSKLPDDVYPIGIYPYHWGVMSAEANGTYLVNSDGLLGYNQDALVEACEVYQTLLDEGLAHPMTTSTDDNGEVTTDYAYAVDDERIVLKRAESWQLGSLTYEYGIAFWPWGSEVTCDGDYTTLSDNYGVSISYWAFDAVVSDSCDALGIPGEVMTQIIWDYRNAISDKSAMHNYWEQEQAGEVTQAGGEYGQARNFFTEEDMELYDWAHTRAVADWSWAYDAVGLMDCWYVFRDIYRDGKDVRSTLESYYNSGKAALEEAGISQSQ